MKTTYRINRIAIASAVRIGVVIAASFGLIIGVFWAFIALFFTAGLSAAFGGELPRASAALAVFIPVMLAVFYTIIGTIGSFLFALLYNLAAGLFGGVEIDMTDNRPAEPPENPRFDFV